MKRLIRLASIFGFAFILQGCVVYPYPYGAYTGVSPYYDYDYGYQSYEYLPYIDFSWGGYYGGGKHYRGRSGEHHGGRRGRGGGGYGGRRYRGSGHRRH
jgi:hypothetical protein